MLVALLVAVSAIGPLVAALAETRVGPLAVLRYVFTSPIPDPATVQQVCREATGACVAAQTRVRLGGWGSGVMSVMPVVLLLVSAVGLWRGRRLAWVAALVLNVALGVAGLALAGHTASRAADQLMMLGSGVHVHAWLVLALPALQPLGVAGVLVATRRRFRQHAPPGMLAAAARTVALTFAARGRRVRGGRGRAAGRFHAAARPGHAAGRPAGPAASRRSTWANWSPRSCP